MKNFTYVLLVLSALTLSSCAGTFVKSDIGDGRGPTARAAEKL